MTSPDQQNPNPEQDDTGGGEPQPSQWVFAHTSVPDEKLQPYRDDGRIIIRYPVTRHAAYDQHVGEPPTPDNDNEDGGSGDGENGEGSDKPPAPTAGVLSGDPEYTAGHIDTHPRYANYGYRQDAGNYDQQTVPHGLIGPKEAWWNQVHPFQRGANHPPTPPGPPKYIIGKENEQTSRPGYWVLQGNISPVPRLDPNDELGWQFDLRMWMNVYRQYRNAGRLVAAEVLFCRRTDAPVPGDGLRGADDKSGYVMSYRTAPGGKKSFVLACWDESANDHVELKRWDVSKFENSWIGVRARVRDAGITVALVNRNSGALLPDYPPYFSIEDNPAKKRLGSKDSGNRGGYIFFGRMIDNGKPGAPEDKESAAFANVRVYPSDGPPPPADGGGGGEKPPPKPNPDPPPPSPPEPEPNPEPEPKPPPPEERTHVVQAGETLGEIAQQYGTSPEAIQKANDLDNPDTIYEGQTLKIPG